MIKRIVSILTTVAIGISLYGQNKYDEIINGYAVDIEEGTIERLNEMEGEKMPEPVSSFIHILNLDAFNYYGFNEKYTSDLQRETFKKSKEYAEYLGYIKQDRDEIIANKYYVFYNLRYNNKYDVSKRAFVFRLGLYDWQRTHTSGYVTLGKKGISVSYPASRTKFTSRRDYYNELYVEQLITIPFNNDEAAIQVEKEIDNPYCSAFLVFEVSLLKTVTEKNPEMPIPQTFLLAKTSGLYLLDKRTKSVWDVSSALK